MSLRKRGYLIEAPTSSWQETGTPRHGGEWMGRFIKELVDMVEGRLAKKVYTVKSKVLRREGAGELGGDMKKVGSFKVGVHVSVKPGSRTGAHKTRVVVSAGGERDERVFASTASQKTIVKWVMQRLDERR